MIISALVKLELMDISAPVL